MEQFNQAVFDSHFTSLCGQLGRINELNYNSLKAINTVLEGPMVIIYIAKYAVDDLWNQMANLLFPNITEPHLMKLASNNGVEWADVLDLDLAEDFDVLNGKAEEQQPLYTLKFLLELARRRGDNRNEPAVVPETPPENKV